MSKVKSVNINGKQSAVLALDYTLYDRKLIPFGTEKVSELFFLGESKDGNKITFLETNLPTAGKFQEGHEFIMTSLCLKLTFEVQDVFAIDGFDEWLLRLKQSFLSMKLDDTEYFNIRADRILSISTPIKMNGENSIGAPKEHKFLNCLQFIPSTYFEWKLYSTSKVGFQMSEELKTALKTSYIELCLNGIKIESPVKS